MKKILTGLLLVAFAIPSYAAKYDEDIIDCAGVSSLASSIMGARLNGATIVDAMEIANDAGDLKPLVTEMVKNAYSEYSYQTEDYKKSAKVDFGTKYYLDCLKHTEK